MTTLFYAALAALAALPFCHAISLDVTDPNSIKAAASTLAYGLLSTYSANSSTTPISAIGTLPEPLYWWEAGAVWGGLIDYWAYTGDDSYNPTVTQALLAQVGPDNNFMPPAYYPSLGNDDQAFWAIAALNAAEYGFPVPAGNASTIWVDLAEAVFNTMVPRWYSANCSGGLQWQVFPSNPGWGYKNSISNGGFFQISARLARLTGNQTYVDWAEKIYDWMEGVGFIDSSYNVWDGASSASNCTQIDHTVWTYNPSMLLYGTAILYNYTTSATWGQRTGGLMEACSNRFFSPYPNATNIMYEWACEPHDNCDNDQYSFKAYLSRWMTQASVVAPFISDHVNTLLTASAQAAAEACSGGANGTVCGQKWYVGGYDGSFGIGQQLSALETVQAMMVLHGDASGAIQTLKSSPPLQQGNSTQHDGSEVDIVTKYVTATVTTCDQETATAAPSSRRKRYAAAHFGHRAGRGSYA